jgi:hypothetical protein
MRWLTVRRFVPFAIAALMAALTIGLLKIGTFRIEAGRRVVRWNMLESVAQAHCGREDGAPELLPHQVRGKSASDALRDGLIRFERRGERLWVVWVPPKVSAEALAKAPLPLDQPVWEGRVGGESVHAVLVDCGPAHNRV